MTMYAKTAEDRRNVASFAHLTRMHPNVRFFQPDPVRAPWHWKAFVNDVALNFWPHKMKGNVEGSRAVVGFNALDAMITEASRDPVDDVIDLLDRGDI